VIVRATFHTGPVGTGSFMVGHERGSQDPQEVEVWLLLLFLPLIPLSRWRVTVAAPGEAQGEAEALELTVHSTSRVGVRAALQRQARAVGLTALAALPLALGVWKAGSPWATPLLSSLLGSVVSSRVLGRVGMAVELGVVLADVAILLLAAMLLDEHTPRVPFRSARGLDE
jgi:hypothetical protein